MPDQWCYCRPEVLQDGRGTGLTLNDLRTNVCNKQTHTLEKKACFFAPGALLSAQRTCQKSTRAHLCTRACECRDAGENKMNASCFIDLFCVPASARSDQSNRSVRVAVFHRGNARCTVFTCNNKVAHQGASITC